MKAEVKVEDDKAAGVKTEVASGPTSLAGSRPFSFACPYIVLLWTTVHLVIMHYCLYVCVSRVCQAGMKKCQHCPTVTQSPRQHCWGLLSLHANTAGVGKAPNMALQKLLLLCEEELVAEHAQEAVRWVLPTALAGSSNLKGCVDLQVKAEPSGEGQEVAVKSEDHNHDAPDGSASESSSDEDEEDEEVCHWHDHPTLLCTLGLDASAASTQVLCTLRLDAKGHC